MNRNGLLIVLEGVDNIGKSETKNGLVRSFELNGFQAEGLEFPYKGFEALRKIGKDKRSSHYERLLAHALSHSMTYPIIDQALNDGKAVVVDRYWYSNLAYATTFAGIEYGYVRDLEGVRLQPVIPDLVVYLYSDGAYPNFMKQDEQQSDLNDAYDSATLQQRKQLLRAYQHIVDNEWSGAGGSLEYIGHNVDRHPSLEDSVACLVEKIDFKFAEKIARLKVQNAMREKKSES